MGKGFNNYMIKKFFHPSSKENIKRVWMAQQKAEFEKKKQEDLMSQYQKEQDLYKNRALLGDEKAKLGLSFMYDAPPGLKKKEAEEPEAEVKFEWQRKYNAPREQYAKNDEMIRDQPFGIEVRNVRCIKCRKWGHVNTDKICPLFNKDLAAEPEQPKTSASSLLESMREDGFTLKQSILGRMSDPAAANEQILDSEDEEDPEVQFLKSLTPKQKKKLLKKLNKLQSKGKGLKKKKKKHKRKMSDSDTDEDPKMKKNRDLERNEQRHRDQKHKSHERRSRHVSSSDSSPAGPSHGERRHRGKPEPLNSSDDENPRPSHTKKGNSQSHRHNRLSDEGRPLSLSMKIKISHRQRHSSSSSDDERPNRRNNLKDRKYERDDFDRESRNEEKIARSHRDFGDKGRQRDRHSAGERDRSYEKRQRSRSLEKREQRPKRSRSRSIDRKIKHGYRSRSRSPRREGKKQVARSRSRSHDRVKRQRSRSRSFDRRRKHDSYSKTSSRGMSEKKKEKRRHSSSSDSD